MRLQEIRPEFEQRLKIRTRPFPLELNGGEPPPRDILEQEWWLAALQEPAALFAPYPAEGWPTTTVPAFEAAWCANWQGEALADRFDLAIRRAFFAQGRNIGERSVLLEIAGEVGLDTGALEHIWDSGEAHSRIVEESTLGRERFGVRGTPTAMRLDGTRVQLPIAFPRMKNRRVVGIRPLPCYGAECRQAMREVLESALSQPVSPRQGGQSC